MQGHHGEDLLPLIWNAARHAGFPLPPVSPRRTGPKLAEILVAQQQTPATRTANSGGLLVSAVAGTARYAAIAAASK
jgi:hypothetical protein